MRTPAEILRGARTIALVGASPKPDRPSHEDLCTAVVHRYELRAG